MRFSQCTCGTSIMQYARLYTCMYSDENKIHTLYIIYIIYIYIIGNNHVCDIQDMLIC